MNYKQPHLRLTQESVTLLNVRCSLALHRSDWIFLSTMLSGDSADAAERVCAWISLRATFLKLLRSCETDKKPVRNIGHKDEWCSEAWSDRVRGFWRHRLLTVYRASTTPPEFSNLQSHWDAKSSFAKQNQRLQSERLDRMASVKEMSRQTQPSLWRDLCFYQRLKTSQDQHLSESAAHDRSSLAWETKLRKQISQRKATNY